MRFGPARSRALRQAAFTADAPNGPARSVWKTQVL
jgi:hypothetical protein